MTRFPRGIRNILKYVYILIELGNKFSEVDIMPVMADVLVV